MGIFGDAKREFIARPDERKQAIFYKWPDHNIRKFSQLTVEQDEQALLFRDGKVFATFPAGRHGLDVAEWPVLGDLLDAATGGNLFLAELYFIGTREFTGLKFGGVVDDVVDAETQFALGLRVFGEYSLKVTAPEALLVQLIGSRQLSRNEEITDWVREFVLREIRANVTRHIMDDHWSVLGLSAHTDTIEQEIVPAVNEKLTAYGIVLVRLGNLTISLSDEDQATLKNFRRDVGYTKLAGGFAQYGAGKALLGIGEGAANGNAGNALLGAGLGIGGLFGAVVPGAVSQPAAPAAAAAPTAPATMTAASESTPAATAARFCGNCGTAAEGGKFCTNCGSKL
jgi:membrane protease subunit (stomatin/prohibitin family)